MGGSSGPFSHRKAPPAHAGSQYPPGFPGPGHLFGGPPPPPSAHGYPNLAYPPGFGYGYTGYGNWDGFNQAFQLNQNQGSGKPKDRDFKERDGDTRDSKDSRDCGRDQRDAKDLRDSRDSRDSRGYNNVSEGSNLGNNLSPPSLTVTKIPGPSNYVPKSQNDLSVSPERHPQRSPSTSQFDFSHLPPEKPPATELIRSSAQIENSYHPMHPFRQESPQVNSMPHQPPSRPPTASPTSRQQMENIPSNRSDPEMSPFSRPPSGASTSSKPPAGFSPNSLHGSGYSPNSRQAPNASPIPRQVAENSPSYRPVSGTSPASQPGNSRPPSSNSRPPSHSSAELNSINILANNPFSRPPSQGSLYEFDRILANANEAGPVSPSSMGFFNSRRKQSTPTKKPTLPGEPSTVLITHAGQPPPPDSPVEDVFQFPQDFGANDQGTNVPATSSLRAIRKQSLKKADVVSPTKCDLDPKILQFNSTEAEPQIKSDTQESQENSIAHQNTEGDFADKESDDENLSLKAVIRKKRASKFSGNLEESDSELESKNITPTKKGRGRPRSQNSKSKSPTFAIPKSSPRNSKKNGNYSTESEIEGNDGSRMVDQRRSSNEDTPQRRRSKGEMKEFPSSAEKKAELFQKLEEDLEAMFQDTKDPEPIPENHMDHKEMDDKTNDEEHKDVENPKEQVFQKVEDDLEAMFAGLEDNDNADDIPETKPTPGAVKRKSRIKSEPRKSKGEPKVKSENEKKKRNKKIRAARNDSESDTFDYNPEDDQEPAFKPEVPARSKSKRKSAQNAELRFRESNSDDDDFLMKRYFQKEDKQASLLSSIKTKVEKSTIEENPTELINAKQDGDHPNLEEDTKKEKSDNFLENTKQEEQSKEDVNDKVKETAKVEDEDEIQILNENKPVNLAAPNAEGSKQRQDLEKTKEEPKTEVVLETSVIRPKKLTRAMQESLMEKMKKETEMQSLKSINEPINISDSKPDIIEIPSVEVNQTATSIKDDKQIVEADSSNQEEESENISLSERKGKRKTSRQPLKKEVKPIEFSSGDKTVETAMDLSVHEKEEIKSQDSQVKTEEKQRGRKTRRSQKANEEDIKPEDELKEHILDDCKDEQKKETDEKESPVIERRTRRSHGKTDDIKDTLEKEINNDKVPSKGETKFEQEQKIGSLKSENSYEQTVDTKRRKLRRSNEDLDKSKEAEDFSLKKEIEVVGSRSGRKTRRARASEENLAKYENATNLDDKENISLEGTNDLSNCHENSKEKLQKNEEKKDKDNSSVLDIPKLTLEECKEDEETKSENIPRGRQMGRRSRPLRKKENHLETDSTENGDISPEKPILPRTKKMDIKLKKVEIKTKDGIPVSTTFKDSKADQDLEKNEIKNQNNVQKKDVKDSPPVARRSRRSRDPNLDDSLEIDKSSIPINQTKPSTEKIEASPGNQSEKMEETSKTRRSKKRNLSTSDSNTSQNLDTSRDDSKNNKKARLEVSESEKPSRRNRGAVSDEPLNILDKSNEPEDKSEECKDKDKVQNSEHGKTDQQVSLAMTENETAKSAVLQEIIDVTDDEEMAKADDADDISILEVEDSNDVQSDSINELLDSAEASNIESNDTSPVRGKKRGRKPGSKNKPKKAKNQDENNDLGKQLNKALKKGKKYTQVEVLLERFKGPFVHIEGSFRSPNFVNVINSSNDSLGPRSISQRGICDSELRPKLTNFGHNSALSKQYDSRNLDQSWVCVFCHKTSHFRGLGDLFGPYWLPAGIVKTPQKVRKDSQNSESSRKGGRKRRKSEISEISVEAAPTEDNSKTEIWFHEDCFIWIPNTFLVGGRIVGLEEGVEQCQDLTCSVCHNRGASVGCTAHGCKEAAHVYCAQQAGWHLDIHNFDAKCVNCVTSTE